MVFKKRESKIKSISFSELVQTRTRLSRTLGLSRTQVLEPSRDQRHALKLNHFIPRRARSSSFGVLFSGSEVLNQDKWFSSPQEFGKGKLEEGGKLDISTKTLRGRRSYSKQT